MYQMYKMLFGCSLAHIGQRNRGPGLCDYLTMLCMLLSVDVATGLMTHGHTIVGTLGLRTPGGAHYFSLQ